MNAPRRSAASNRRTVVFFLLRCVAYWAIALLLVTRVPAIERAGVGLTVASLVGLLHPFDAAIHREGDIVMTRGAAVQIVPDCSPHMPFLIFAAVVLAFPSSWRQRLIGLLLGAVVIFAFNTLRIVTLMWVLARRREWFDFAHVYLWQTGTILIVFFTFAIWIRTLAPRPRPA